MKYRALGGTGIEVSEIGFGTWGIGGTSQGSVAYGETDDKKSAESLLTAVDRGINFFDTSDFYGHGHSEELLGAALHEVRSQVVICTKAGFTQEGKQNFCAQYIQGCIEKSLARLQTSYIDLFLLHSPTPEHLSDNHTLFDLMDKLKTVGAIRHWGISARNPAEALMLLEKYNPECIEVNFNLVDLRAIECGLWTACQDHRTGIIVRTPLAFGFLSGKIPSDQAFASNDHRSRFSAEQKKLWTQSVPLYHEIFKKDVEATPSQNALRFCLSFPEVSTTIPGMLAPEEVRENAVASDLGPMKESLLHEILELSSKQGFFK